MLLSPVMMMMVLAKLVVVLVITRKMVVSTMSHAIYVNRARVRGWLAMRIRATCIVRILRVRYMTVLCFALVIQPRRFGFVNGANNKAAENSVKNNERNFAVNS